jgi:hypothetical protein
VRVAYLKNGVHQFFRHARSAQKRLTAVACYQIATPQAEAATRKASLREGLRCSVLVTFVRGCSLTVEDDDPAAPAQPPSEKIRDKLRKTATSEM